MINPNLAPVYEQCPKFNNSARVWEIVVVV